MTVVKRPSRRVSVIGAALLAPLVLLGARRAVRAAALRRNEPQCGSLAPGRAATLRPTPAAATIAPVGAAAADVEPASVAGRRRKGRTLRLALAAASVALLGVFIQYGQSRVPRPTLVVGQPTNVSRTTETRPSADEVPKSPDSMVPSRTTSAITASTPAAPRRSAIRPRRHTLRQHDPKHQSHAGVLPAKHARERPASRVQAVGGRALQRLRWNAVAGATYYNLVLWREGKRVLDLWPTSPRVVVPTTLVKHGPKARLSPGRYLWFVYPGFGAKSARHYGALAGSGVLVVQPKGGNEG
jgi:hypothetical protein